MNRSFLAVTAAALALMSGVAFAQVPARAHVAAAPAAVGHATPVAAVAATPAQRHHRHHKGHKHHAGKSVSKKG